jgi:hypothetical protein
MGKFPVLFVFFGLGEEGELIIQVTHAIAQVQNRSACEIGIFRFSSPFWGNWNRRALEGYFSE